MSRSSASKAVLIFGQGIGSCAVLIFTFRDLIYIAHKKIAIRVTAAQSKASVHLFFL